MFQKISQWLDRGTPHKAPEGRLCDDPDCQKTGEHRAPRSRQQLENGEQDWLWFCLEHIRDYNSKWNYYTGMNEEEQLQERLDDVVWQRPSWPLGDRHAKKKLNLECDDPLGIFDQNSRSSSLKSFSVNNQRLRDLKIFGLKDDFTKNELQQRYRLLAKEYHPDLNDKPETVEHFHEIKDAYERLKQSIL